MTRPWLALWASTALAAAACGARTGLVDDRPADAGPDHDADPDEDSASFPCNYSRTGTLAPLAPWLGQTFLDDLASGGDRLAAALAPAVGRRLQACTTSASRDWACPETTELEPFSYYGGPARLAWNGERFGVCWLEDVSPLAIRYQQLSTEGFALWDEPVTFTGRDACWALVWLGDRYLIAYDVSDDLSEDTLVVSSMDLEGQLGGDLLRLPGGLHTPFALAADGDVAAAAWLDSSDLRLRTLAGLPEADFSVASSGDGPLALALRGAQAALLWAAVGDDSFRLLLTLVDLESGGVGEPTEVAASSGTLLGLDLVGVGEGYVVAWSQLLDGSNRETVVPTRNHGLSVEVRDEIVLFEAPVSIPFALVITPSLAYDGLDVFAGVTVPRDDGTYEARVQRLACHR